MKIKASALAAAAILFISSASLSAQESIDALLSENGITLLSKEVVAGKNVYSFSAPGNIAFSVESAGDIGEKAARSAFQLMDTLMGWKSITPGSQQFRIDGDTVTLRLVPGKFVTGKRDLKPFVPSGLAFSINGTRIEYDFRIKSGAYFLRFAGRLQNEASFLDRLVSAVDDPATFAKANDPEYLSTRMVELYNAIEAETKAREAAETKLNSAVARIDALENKNAELADKDANLDKQLLEMTSNLNAAQTALMAVHSKGLFGAPKTVPVEVVDAIRKLKAENPKMTAVEVTTALKNQKIAATDRQIKAVLAVLYGKE